MLTAQERTLVSEFAVQRPAEANEAHRLLGGRGRAPSRRGIVRLTESDLPELRMTLDDHVAAVVSGFLDSDEVNRIAARVLKHWRDDPHAAPISAYGAAFFMHIGQDEAAYFERAEPSRTLVEALAPGLTDRVLAWAREVAQAPVELRDRWAGPGFVVIDTRLLEGEAGDVHLDWEGLAAHPTAPLGTECYSLLSLIQDPESGSALKVWDAGLPRLGQTRAGGSDGGDDLVGDLIHYRTGDLVVIDSLSLHQIQPVHGTRPRVMLTAHLARFPEGWCLWL